MKGSDGQGEHDGSIAGGSATGAGSEPVRRGALAWARDWRVWLGIGISAGCIWYMARGVPLDEVRRAMGGADLPLLIAISLPSYVLNIWLRALRWRHLTNPIAPIPRGLLYRAQAIGFMVNNLIPLRVGELVRSWYLAREVNRSRAAILGTVVLERVLDIVSVLAVAAGALAVLGAGGGEDDLLARGARLLVPIAIAPLAGLIVMRLMPETIYRVARFACRPLPPHLGEWIESSLRKFADGLGALSGGSHLFWIVFYSAAIWLVASTLPVIAAVWAFGLDLGSPSETLIACWILLAASGVAVAIPSAPGFFGPYQLAYKEVLVRFGVDPATALAVGMLVWVLFWVSLTVQGFVVLRSSSGSLTDLTRRPDSAAE